MNVTPSPVREPLDQLDGLAVYKASGCFDNMYTFIAGVYDSLNAQSAREARCIAKRRRRLEIQKKNMLNKITERAKVYGGFTYTTYDLWNDTDYWEIFKDKVSLARSSGRFPTRLKMKDFPMEILGRASEVLKKGSLDEYAASSLYTPLEVAEAIWFKEKRNVGFKIGPYETEKPFDDEISKFDIGIIGLKQPYCVKKGKLIKTSPYRGQKNEERVFLSDNYDAINEKLSRNPGNPSYERAEYIVGLLFPELVCERKKLLGMLRFVVSLSSDDFKFFLGDAL